MVVLTCAWLFFMVFNSSWIIGWVEVEDMRGRKRKRKRGDSWQKNQNTTNKPCKSKDDTILRWLAWFVFLLLANLLWLMCVMEWRSGDGRRRRGEEGEERGDRRQRGEGMAEEHGRGDDDDDRCVFDVTNYIIIFEYGGEWMNEWLIAQLWTNYSILFYPSSHSFVQHNPLSLTKTSPTLHISHSTTTRLSYQPTLTDSMGGYRVQVGAVIAVANQCYCCDWRCEKPIQSPKHVCHIIGHNVPQILPIMIYNDWYSRHVYWCCYVDDRE